MLVRVKMLDRGPNKTYKKGQIIEVDDARALALVGDGHAEYVLEESQAEEVK